MLPLVTKPLVVMVDVIIFPGLSYNEAKGAIHSTKVPTGPTGKSGPPQKVVDPFFRNFSGWTEPIHWVLEQNFRKFWLNGSRPNRTFLNGLRKNHVEAQVEFTSKLWKGLGSPCY